MNSTSFFIIFVFIIAVLLLALNLLLAPHNPNKAKDNVFECGFDSFIDQNRQEFDIQFSIFAMLFIVFDIDIFVIFPFIPSTYNNELFGFTMLLIILIILTIGFIFEIGKNALVILSKQFNINNKLKIL